MNLFLDRLEKILLPVAEKLNGQRHLAALRDGFIAVMPLMIIGAFAVMFNNVFLNAADESLIATIFLRGNGIDPANYPAPVIFIRSMNDVIVSGSIGIIALIVSFTIAYNLTEIKGYKGVEAGVVSVASFMMTLATVDGTIASGFFGSANIITAILIALVSAEMYTFFLKRDIRIKMPDTVPPAVERSFSALVPAAVIFIIVAFIQVLIITGTELGSFSEVIQVIIGAPLKKVGGGYIGMSIYLIFTNVFWFFGIHGPNTLAFMDQIVFTPAAVQNTALIGSGIIDNWKILDPTAVAALIDVEKPTIYTKTLIDSYVFIGGSGATLGLIISILIASKQEASRKMAKYSFTPALFNINEPLLFGLPIVFNPILFIPFVIIQPILFTTTILAMDLGLIPLYGTLIPWTSPVGVGAFLGYGGSVPAFLFAIFQLVLATIIYYPFVVIMNKANNNVK